MVVLAEGVVLSIDDRGAVDAGDVGAVFLEVEEAVEAEAAPEAGEAPAEPAADTEASKE